MPQNTPRVAVLIDGDNISMTYISNILKLCEKHGTLVVREAYGDWLASNLSGHVEGLTQLGITTVQQKRYATGDNATDMRIAMEAVLHRERDEADMFCVVSSDSDFVPVFEKLRAMGAKVVGIGAEEQSKRALCDACDTFYFTERLEQYLAPPKPAIKPVQPPTPSKHESQKPKSAKNAVQLLQKAYNQAARGQNHTSLSALGTVLLELAPNYKKDFGVTTLAKWIQSMNAGYIIQGNNVKYALKPKKQPKPKQSKLNLQSDQLDLLIQAYQQTEKSKNGVHMGQVGNVLREIDPQYKDHFGNKKLSTWFKAYPGHFKVDKDHVRLV